MEGSRLGSGAARTRIRHSWMTCDIPNSNLKHCTPCPLSVPIFLEKKAGDRISDLRTERKHNFPASSLFPVSAELSPATTEALFLLSVFLVSFNLSSQLWPTHRQINLPSKLCVIILLTDQCH